jgi:hypothetical protein
MLTDDIGALLNSADATPDQIIKAVRGSLRPQAQDVPEKPTRSWVQLDDWMAPVKETSTAKDYNARRNEWIDTQLPEFVRSRLGDEPGDPESKQGKAWRKQFDAAISHFGDGAEKRFPTRKGDTAGDVAANAGLSFTQGIVGFFGSVASLAGADNPVAKYARQVDDSLQTFKSPDSKAKKALSSAEIAAAEATGSISNEVGAYLGALARQPEEAIPQALASLIGGGVGWLAKGAAATRAVSAGATAAQAAKIGATVGTIANFATGAAQGLGSIKGAQYETTLQAAKAQGLGDEEAQALAVKAQNYGVDNLVPHLALAVLGGVAGSSGFEHFLAGGRAAGGLGRRMLTQGAAEAVPEIAQGAGERLAANTSAIDAGVMDAGQRMRGVYGQGVQGGVLGFGLGAATGIPGRPKPKALIDELKTGEVPPNADQRPIPGSSGSDSGIDPGVAVAGRTGEGSSAPQAVGTDANAASAVDTDLDARIAAALAASGQPARPLIPTGSQGDRAAPIIGTDGQLATPATQAEQVSGIADGSIATDQSSAAGVVPGINTGDVAGPSGPTQITGSVEPRFADGSQVVYQGVTGELQVRSDGIYVVAADGSAEIFVESGFSGASLDTLGIEVLPTQIVL